VQRSPYGHNPFGTNDCNRRAINVKLEQRFQRNINKLIKGLKKHPFGRTSEAIMVSFLDCLGAEIG
jgi:hypothetical protein